MLNYEANNNLQSNLKLLYSKWSIKRSLQNKKAKENTRVSTKNTNMEKADFQGHSNVFCSRKYLKSQKATA